MKPETRLLHAGHPRKDEPGVLTHGPQFSSTYVTPGDPATHPLSYGRFQNPTWTAWETALAELEGAPTIAFPSGMAATAAVFGATLRPGDVLVLPAESYYSTRVLAQDWFAPMGVQVRTAPTPGNAQASVLDGARLLWLETPSNPGLEVCDIAWLCEKARSQGTMIAVDNTTATPWLQRPLELGATISMASDTKAMTGHSDLLLGHVASEDAELMARVRQWRTQMGSIPGPMEVWLAHRSLSTLPLRLARQCDSAEQLAGMLAGHRAVRAVHYPGLKTHPGHEIAKKQMTRFGSVVSFDLETLERADRFLKACELVREATSFGGVHTTAERRARWGTDAVSPGFIRFSVGCEATEDLLADVGQALDRLPRT